MLKLPLERMRAARVIVFVDSTMRPVQEHGYLLQDVLQVVLPDSSLKQMHAVAHYLVKHIVAPSVMVFCNVIDDLANKGILKDVRTNKEGAVHQGALWPTGGYGAHAEEAERSYLQSNASRLCQPTWICVLEE